MNIFWLKFLVLRNKGTFIQVSLSVWVCFCWLPMCTCMHGWVLLYVEATGQYWISIPYHTQCQSILQIIFYFLLISITIWGTLRVKLIFKTSKTINNSLNIIELIFSTFPWINIVGTHWCHVQIRKDKHLSHWEVEGFYCSHWQKDTKRA